MWWEYSLFVYLGVKSLEPFMVGACAAPLFAASVVVSARLGSGEPAEWILELLALWIVGAGVLYFLLFLLAAPFWMLAVVTLGAVICFWAYLSGRRR